MKQLKVLEDDAQLTPEQWHVAAPNAPDVVATNMNIAEAQGQIGVERL